MKILTKIIRKGKGAVIRAIADDDGENKRCVIFEFVKEMGRKMPTELTKLSRLWSDTAQEGPPKNTEKFKPLTGSDGIYEFKTSKLRVLCFKDDGNYIICTHGFVKKSQKTPKKEITKAEDKKKDYFKAKKNGNLRHEE
jgi:phage-related protein